MFLIDVENVVHKVRAERDFFSLAEDDEGVSLSLGLSFRSISYSFIESMISLARGSSESIETLSDPDDDGMAFVINIGFILDFSEIELVGGVEIPGELGLVS